MDKFRKVIFWLHLVAGAIGGIVIFIMCVTGALLSFEKNIAEFAERDMRFVAPNDNACRHCNNGAGARDPPSCSTEAPAAASASRGR